MFVLGVTGPSGAGKGTACALLKELGFYHIDTDRLVPQVYPIAAEKLVAAFGPEVLRDGMVDRKVLAQRAFASPESTMRLNSIMHPLVMKRVSDLICSAEAEGYFGVAVDGAALHEAHAETICDKILCILSPRETRLERVVRRDGIPLQSASLRFSAQKSDAYYAENSDAVIENRTLEQLKEELFQKIKEWTL
jgi:dephospho-CoA kinase